MHATLVAFTDNTLLTLNRIVSLLRGRNFDVAAVTQARTNRRDVASMTIVVGGDDRAHQRVAACLEKLDDVWDVAVMDRAHVVRRELALVEVTRSEASGPTFERLEPRVARLLDGAGRTAVVELVGESDEIDAAVELLRPLGIVGLARVGPVALVRAEPSGDHAAVKL